MARMEHCFSLFLRTNRQMPAIQTWLHQQCLEQQSDDIAVYKLESDEMYQVVIVQGMSVENLNPPSHVKAILTNRFQWPEVLADQFLEEYGQVLLFTLGDGSELYYCRPIDMNEHMISFGSGNN